MKRNKDKPDRESVEAGKIVAESAKVCAFYFYFHRSAAIGVASLKSVKQISKI